MVTISLAIAGVGKIARDQHLPAIAADDRFHLAATVSHSGGVADLPNFPTIAEMVAACPEIAALSICTPPRGRLDLVREALAHGLHIMLEKPPAATLSEAEAIVSAANAAGRVVFATWHSRGAAGVDAARDWLRGRAIERVVVTWKEDVRVWHPGQEWIWEPGIGVFDPGINALSILTKILPLPLLVEDAELSFPANRAAPIAATLMLRAGGGVPIAVSLDFDQRGPQTWDIRIDTADETLRLTEGGSRLFIDDAERKTESAGEYPTLYSRFAELLDAGHGEVDLAPFRLVADSFILARHTLAPSFDWQG